MALHGALPYVIAGSIIVESLTLINVIPAPMLVYTKAAFGAYFMYEAVKYTIAAIGGDVQEEKQIEEAEQLALTNNRPLLATGYRLPRLR